MSFPSEDLRADPLKAMSFSSFPLAFLSRNDSAPLTQRNADAGISRRFSLGGFWSRTTRQERAAPKALCPFPRPRGPWEGGRWVGPFHFLCKSSEPNLAWLNRCPLPQFWTFRQQCKCIRSYAPRPNGPWGGGEKYIFGGSRAPKARDSPQNPQEKTNCVTPMYF